MITGYYASQDRPGWYAVYARIGPLGNRKIGYAQRLDGHRGPRGGRPARWRAWCADPTCRWRPPPETHRATAGQQLHAHREVAHPDG